MFKLLISASEISDDVSVELCKYRYSLNGTHSSIVRLFDHQLSHSLAKSGTRKKKKKKVIR